jgi:DNA repair protein RecO (recombination protein O)
MHWDDSGILLSLRKHGENSAVVRLLTQSHGVYSGLLRAPGSPKHRGMQPGNLLSARWQARLEEHMGTFTLEPEHAVAAYLMQDARRLAALASACAMIQCSLPERHPYPRLYSLFRQFLDDLLSNIRWQEDYVLLELDLLAEAGFGLDLSRCAASGTTEDLIYVSPKSGRAVSREAGAPYRDKLLPLPSFLRADPHEKFRATAQEILAGVRLSGYFLEHLLLAPHRRKLPAARGRLMEILKEDHVEKIARHA